MAVATKTSLQFTVSNVLRGAIIYAAGDSIAALILDEFMLSRLLGMMLIGATIYAFEIPNYFAWIDRKSAKYTGWKKSLYRTGLAMAYFNPLWVARHLLFIQLFSFQFEQISWNILTIATISFAVNILISFFGNYLIQNSIPLKWRFMASAIFSALMAIYFAMSLVWFA